MERISGNDNKFSSERIKYLNNVRIIQTNLIHAHGFPSSIARTELLKSKEYFGRYGTIIKATKNRIIEIERIFWEIWYYNKSNYHI